MSRIYVLNAPRLAVAAGRMKTDVNFLGATDKLTVKWMEDNHVFILENWYDGKITEKRLQRLYHRIFPGDFLLMDFSLSKPFLVKALSYVKELEAKTVLYTASGLLVEPEICTMTDFLVDGGAHIIGKPANIIRFGTGEFAESSIGALMLCMMNGLSIKKAEVFFKKAARHPQLPWYDEIAYTGGWEANAGA